MDADAVRHGGRGYGVSEQNNTNSHCATLALALALVSGVRPVLAIEEPGESVRLSVIGGDGGLGRTICPSICPSVFCSACRARGEVYLKGRHCSQHGDHHQLINLSLLAIFVCALLCLLSLCPTSSFSKLFPSRLLLVSPRPRCCHCCCHDGFHRHCSNYQQ